MPSMALSPVDIVAPSPLLGSGVDRDTVPAETNVLKGNDLTREAYDLLKESKLNFLGNVEGRDIYNGQCDVIVTDGFTGNVALKISESLAEMIGAMIKEELTRDLRSRVGAALSMPAFHRFRKRVDYTEMGGAPLLGIDGICIICHGSSGDKAIKNALLMAAQHARAKVNELIVKELESSPSPPAEDE